MFFQFRLSGRSIVESTDRGSDWTWCHMWSAFVCHIYSLMSFTRVYLSLSCSVFCLCSFGTVIEWTGMNPELLMPIWTDSNLSGPSEQETVHLVQLKLQVMKQLDLDSECRAVQAAAGSTCMYSHTQTHTHPVCHQYFNVILAHGLWLFNRLIFRWVTV